MNDSILKSDDVDNNKFDFMEVPGSGEAAAAFRTKQPRVENPSGGGGRDKQRTSKHSADSEKDRLTEVRRQLSSEARRIMGVRTRPDGSADLSHAAVIKRPGLERQNPDNHLTNHDMLSMVNTRLALENQTERQKEKTRGVTSDTVRSRAEIATARKFVTGMDIDGTAAGISNDAVPNVTRKLDAELQKHLDSGGTKDDPTGRALQRAIDATNKVRKDMNDALLQKMKNHSLYEDPKKISRLAGEALKDKYAGLSEQIKNAKAGSQQPRDTEAARSRVPMSEKEVAEARRRQQEMDVSTGRQRQSTAENPVANQLDTTEQAAQTEHKPQTRDEEVQSLSEREQARILSDPEQIDTIINTAQDSHRRLLHPLREVKEPSAVQFKTLAQLEKQEDQFGALRDFAAEWKQARKQKQDTRSFKEYMDDLKTAEYAEMDASVGGKIPPERVAYMDKLDAAYQIGFAKEPHYSLSETIRRHSFKEARNQVNSS